MRDAFYWFALFLPRRWYAAPGAARLRLDWLNKKGQTRFAYGAISLEAAWRLQREAKPASAEAARAIGANAVWKKGIPALDRMQNSGYNNINEY